MPEAVRRYVVILSVFAVVVTLPLWLAALSRTQEDELAKQRDLRKARMAIWNTPLSEGRCTISTATFGPGRARLVRVEKDTTVFYAVLQGSGRKSPMNALYEGDWLRAHFGDVETVTLATYRSAELALAKAGQLCPPRLRCLPGRPGCEGSANPTPLELFSGLSASRPPFAWEGAHPAPWPGQDPKP